MDLALIVGYALIAVLAMIPTWLEQRAKGMDSFARCLPGIGACVLWPVTLATVTILAWQARQDGRSALPD